MDRFFNSNTNSIQQRGEYLERPRLHKLLENAMDYPIVVVCAGSGYGKTRAVHSFVQNCYADITWMQLSERDNVPARYWENFTSILSPSWPEAAARYLELGFPETEEAFARLKIMLDESVKMLKKQIMIFDDFHLLHNPVVIRLIERVAGIISSNVVMIIISRTMPDFNLIGMMMQERVFTIQEKTLCFTEDEIAQYFRQIKLPATGRDINDIYDDTQGWAFAINMIGRTLFKKNNYERYALEAMKKNLFRLIETELSQTISEDLRHFLLRISLIDHLAASLITVLAKDFSKTVITEMESVNAYIRYDFNQDIYMIHHLFLDYLRQNQDQLTDDEKKETYQAAGEWCDTNGYHMDAFSYYEKAGNYSAITRKVDLFNIQIPYDLAQHTLEIFERIPENVKSRDILFPGLHIRLKINIGQLNEETVALVKRYAEDYEARPESPEVNHALSIIYGSWAFLRMLMCTFNDVYDFDYYYKRTSEYFVKSPYELLSKYNLLPVSAWVSLVGTSRAGAQEEYIAATSRAIMHISSVAKGVLSGFDDLLWGELYFYRGEFCNAEKYLKQSIDKSYSCGQYSTQNRALVYMMQIAFFQGDLASAKKSLKEMELLLNEKEYGIRYAMHDIAQGFFQLALEQQEQLLEWLKGDFSLYAHSSFLENYANRIKAQYHYQTHQYSALLAFIENAMEKQTILYGKIELKVLQALSLYQLKRRSEAFAAFTEAWQLAESNRIIVLFTKFGKDMRTLSSAALIDIAKNKKAEHDSKCRIPEEWLEDINRKSSVYAKRKTKVISEYRLANSLGNNITLTKREHTVLKDLADGLSRSEIANSRNLSINTVKMVINSIYDKLYVTTLPEAIRVAVSRKII